MKSIIQCLALGCCMTAHAAQQLVVPGGLENVEGNSSSADLFVNGIAHLQQVFSSSEFAFGAPTGRIDGISFRLDSGTGQNFVGLWPGVTVYMSTTSRSPDSLSPAFSDNIGSDVIRVFGGSLGIFATSAGAEPRPFEVRIRFGTPFFYDPSTGNLAIDVLALGTTGLTLDAQFAAGDSIGRVWANPDALTGTVDTLGLVTRFDITPIPEPSSSIFWLVGIATLCFLSHRRMRSRKV